MAIRVGWLTETSEQARRIGAFRQVLVAPSAMKRRVLKLDSPADIADLPFVANTALREHLRWTFSSDEARRQTVRVQASIFLDATLAAREAVCQGAGLSVLPDYAVAADLAAGVGAQLPEAQVSVHDGQAGRNAAYRVAVDIERFDATLNDSVAVQALWTLRQEGGKELGSGRFAATEPTGPGGYDAIAAAYGKALSAMSAEVAKAVRGAQAAPR